MRRGREQGEKTGRSRRKEKRRGEWGGKERRKSKKEEINKGKGTERKWGRKVSR